MLSQKEKEALRAFEKHFMKEKEFLKSLLGRDKKTAAKLCLEAKMSPTLTREDKTVYACTCDLRFDRVNLEYDDGLVTNAWIG